MSEFPKLSKREKEFIKQKASKLIESICLPAGCQNVVTNDAGNIFRCRVLTPPRATVLLEGVHCDSAIVNNQNAKVSKRGVILING